VRPIDGKQAGNEYRVEHHFGTAGKGSPMASVHFGVDRPVERAAGLPPAPKRQAPKRQMAGEGLDRDLLSLYEQLLATRVDLVHVAAPGDGHLTLSRGELECLIAQLDSAIIGARHLVSSAARSSGPVEDVVVFQLQYGAGQA
jgi:hypothetical protein